MKSRTKYDHKTVEPKWQKIWLKKGTYSPDLDEAKNPFYNLFMFPYPSAEGMHAGHALSSTGSDIFGRFMRMQGKDVFQPMGYDSFGIHSENYALKIGEHPQAMLKHAIRHYEEQFKSFGHGYDWNHTVTTSDISYYKWTQWIFSELFKAGLAYRKKAEVNWCPSCKTVLADEQVMTPREAGKIPPGYKSMKEVPEGLRVCERCGNIVEKKNLEQWFFRITDYAQNLLDNLKTINWSERIKVAQTNWIGESKGMLIKFKKEDGEEIEVYTTRPDTLSGATFIAVSDDDLYNKYKDTDKKFGEFTGEYAVNPLNNKKLPIWKTNYVASGYGTGNIMGVPSHDERDMEFAKKYHLDVVKIKPNNKLWTQIEDKGWGKKYTNYHLRDWLISRQRYWGPPIPMIYCQSCAEKGLSYFTKYKPSIRKDQSDWNPAGWYVEESLPVELPYIKDYQPKGSGRGPLEAHPEFFKVTCPHCGRQAKRETDVSDTFLDSSWYFLRYPSVDSKTASSLAFDPVITKKWLPVNLYFGGAEHAVLHLMYARFVTMVLHDLKKINFEEPFSKFFAHGLMIKDGAKMSKSRGNVVNPDEYVAKFGADTLRLYLVFIGPMDGYPDFRDTGIEGMQRFTGKIWDLFTNYKDVILEDENDSKKIMIKMHQTIKKVTNDIEKFHYNTAISSIMEFVSLLREKAEKNSVKPKAGIRCAEWDQALKTLAQILAPFAPHLAEEVWVEILGQKFSIHTSKWPEYDIDLTKDEQIDIVIQVNGRVRSQISIPNTETSKEEIIKLSQDDEKAKKWIGKKKVKKVVYIPGKIINFVI